MGTGSFGKKEKASAGKGKHLFLACSSSECAKSASPHWTTHIYDSLRLELIGLNLVVSSLNTTRRLIRFENILALKRLHVGKGIEPIDLLGMVSIQLFFPKVFEWVKRNALYLCDERRSDLPPLNPWQFDRCCLRD